ncbi:MAG: hypothetical protein COV44_03210 [Deltaproteobacteria bacterium CG11_big_fil_rev_8_21_14_0_20_45_16]|nr:MAG: hypothetical protein COV44_03210 [Deltaproteobacteria bacterium CG11_big_fil_rev_8_21_14_0_20_45_16]
MFKSLTTRISLTVTSLLIVSILTATWFLAKLSIEERRSYVLDTLSYRSRIQNLEITQRNMIPSKIISEFGVSLVDSLGQIQGKLASEFNGEELLLSLPPSGSIVSECSDKLGRSHYCSISKLKEPNIWLLEAYPTSTIREYLGQIQNQILWFALALLALSIVTSLLLSRWLSKPLKSLMQATRKISEGQYTDLALNPNRKDEIGELNKAFEKMIQEVRKREQDLKISGLKLVHSERLATIGQLGAGIAHEIKNPLTAMKGYARILNEKSNDAELKEASKIIIDEADRCSAILQQMLRFSRKGGGPEKAYRIQDVIDSTLLLAKSQAKSHHIKLINLEKSDAIVRGEPQELQQVLLNLIINALQASAPQSEVKIQTKLQPEYVQLVVSDQGLGIPLNVQPKVFEAFFTTKNEENGSGLGLSISKDIIEKQGGQLRFQSREGAGTEFEISLPLAKA